MVPSPLLRSMMAQTKLCLATSLNARAVGFGAGFEAGFEADIAVAIFGFLLLLEVGWAGGVPGDSCLFWHCCSSCGMSDGRIETFSFAHLSEALSLSESSEAGVPLSSARIR